MSTVIGPYHAGEIPPPLVVTFRDSNGNPLDFSVNGPWAARFVYRPYAGAQTTRTPSAPVSGNGQVTYIWVAGDFTVPGDYEAEMWVGNGGPNRYDSIRLVYQVKPALAMPVI